MLLTKIDIYKQETQTAGMHHKESQSGDAPKPPFAVKTHNKESENQAPYMSDFQKKHKRCSQKCCADWLWHFAKRARVVPFWDETDLGEIPKTL